MLDDSSWPLILSALPIVNDTATGGFKGIGWLRLHFVLDSSAASRTLALRLKQDGASEIYLDGKLLRTYGRLLPADSAEYINPHELPLSLPTLQQGPHLLAIRYANWAYRHNAKRHNAFNPGPRVSLWDAVVANESYFHTHSNGLFATVLLFGIFITLAVVHLILYLYYRAEKANLRFSLFALHVAAMLLVPAIMRISEDATLMLQLSTIEALLLALTGASLSNLLNTLFTEKRKWHAYIVFLAWLSLILMLIFWRRQVMYGGLAVLVLVPLEAVYILIGALRRRLPGARIIGGGLLLLLTLLLLAITLVLTQGDIYVNESTLFGQLLLVAMVLAILSIPVSMSMYLAWRFSRISRDLNQRLLEVERLSAQARDQEAEKQRMLQSRQEELEEQVAERTASLRTEKQKSDDLLLNILPEEVAEELKQTGSSAARLYNEVSVLFTDFVDFTQISEALSPADLVAEIDTCFKAFDHITEKHGLEKIKTVGDAYIAVCGLPAPNSDHAASVLRAALEIRDYMVERARGRAFAFGIRLGVHSGPVVAGIVGVKKFAYDIWGDTVNTAARMEQSSEGGKINISAATYELIKDKGFITYYRGEIEAKHKGKLGMYFVEKGTKAMA